MQTLLLLVIDLIIVVMRLYACINSGCSRLESLSDIFKINHNFKTNERLIQKVYLIKIAIELLIKILYKNCNTTCIIQDFIPHYLKITYVLI